MSKILIVDDDRDMCMLLTRFLERKGFEPIQQHTGKGAIEWMQENKPDLILCDFRLDDMTGAELLKEFKEIHSDVPVIIVTGYSDVKDAVSVMKIGALDYITKPLVPEEILITIKKALAGEHENQQGNSAPSPTSAKETENGKAVPGKTNKDGKIPEYIFSESQEFANTMKQIRLVAPTNYSVIIYGESGSGKEAIAREIHNQSDRANKAFVAIDCGALSKELAASELFGHEKGAFTGALMKKVGSFEVAHEGTIFLDEVANLSYDIQVALLRVIQERKIKRLGSNKDMPIDIRIIVASNESLWEAAKDGKFREDLYHRFNEFTINVPPLRERKSDIMLYADHFLQLTNKELGKGLQGFSKEVEKIFTEYVWYGNLREMKNVVKRAALLTEGMLIDAKSLPFEIVNYKKLNFDDEDIDADEQSNGSESAADRLKNANIDAEYEVILDVLKQTNYNKTKAAEILNIDRKTLYNKLNQYKALKANK